MTPLFSRSFDFTLVRKVCLHCIQWQKILTLYTLLLCLPNILNAQNPISINVQESSILDVLKEIEVKSDFIFLLDEKQVDVSRKVTLSVSNKNIESILNKLFIGTVNTYKIYGNQVIILPNEQSKAKRLLEQDIQPIEKKILTGTLTDLNGEAIPGVTIIVKGTTIGTVSDIEGVFSLEVPIEAKSLLFSFVGMVTQEIQIGDNINFNVQMEDMNTGLDELVVVGYGVQKKASSVASITQTKGEDLLKVGSVTSVSEALQGLMPGVTATLSSGKPGADAADILIRGKASWQGSSPLVLVDGVERDMNDIDPNEIESISVLKDASATAVFGVKGGNGVILVTTKRGMVSKPKFSTSVNFGFKQPTAQPEFADHITAMNMWNEALRNDKQWDILIPESTINGWQDNLSEAGPYNDYYPEIDWWNEMVKKVGYQQQVNMNVRGGTDFMKYFISLGYLNDGDIFKTEKTDLFDPRFRYQRFNWRTNLDFTLTESTVFSANVAGKLGYRNQAGYRIDADGEGQGDTYQNKFFKALYVADRHSFPILWDDGTYGSAFDGSGNLKSDFENGQRTYKYYQTFLDFKLKQHLDFVTKGLSLKGLFSYSSSSNYQSSIQKFSGSSFGQQFGPISYYRLYDYANPNPDASYNLIEETRFPDANVQSPPPTAVYDELIGGAFVKKLYYEIALNYARDYDDHSVTALALFSRREKKSATYEIQQRQEDWVGRVTYAFKDRYLFDVNGSYNGSESFAPELRFGLFMSGSAGWRISEEPFVKELMGDYLTNLKVRYSYGTSGFDPSTNNPDKRFAYQQSYSAGSNVGFGTTSQVNYGPLYIEGSLANPNATWEESVKQNLGLEFGLFSKLTGTIELYKELRKNILMDLWLPVWVIEDTKQATANVGEAKNHGIELELGWNDGIGDDVRYWVSGSVALSESRIVERGDGEFTPEYQKMAGKPIGTTKAYLNNGYYQGLDDIFIYGTPENATLQGQLVPGDLMFVDYNLDGNIDDNDKVDLEDLDYPLNTYGLNLGVSYKGFSLSTFFYGVSNLKRMVSQEFIFDNTSGHLRIYNAYPDVTNRWTIDNAENAEKPSLHQSGSNISKYNMNGSTYRYRDVSYIRLKNVELSYNFPKKTLDKINIGKLQVYVNGNNLFTWTKLQDYLDPESAGNDYPIMRRFNIGLRTSF